MVHDDIIAQQNCKRLAIHVLPCSQDRITEPLRFFMTHLMDVDHAGDITDHPELVFFVICLQAHLQFGIVVEIESSIYLLPLPVTNRISSVPEAIASSSTQ